MWTSRKWQIPGRAAGRTNSPGALGAGDRGRSRGKGWTRQRLFYRRSLARASPVGSAPGIWPPAVVPPGMVAIAVAPGRTSPIAVRTAPVTAPARHMVTAVGPADPAHVLRVSRNVRGRGNSRIDAAPGHGGSGVGGKS